MGRTATEEAKSVYVSDVTDINSVTDVTDINSITDVNEIQTELT